MMGDMYSPNEDRADAAERALQRYQAMLELGYKQAQVGAAQEDLGRKQHDSYLKNLRGGLGTLNTLTGDKGVYSGASPMDIQVLMLLLNLDGVPTTPFTERLRADEKNSYIPHFYGR